MVQEDFRNRVLGNNTSATSRRDGATILFIIYAFSFVQINLKVRFFFFGFSKRYLENTKICKNMTQIKKYQIE